MFYLLSSPRISSTADWVSYQINGGLNISWDTFSSLSSPVFLFCIRLIILSPFRHIQPNNGFCQQRPQSQLRQTEARLRLYPSHQTSALQSHLVEQCLNQERPQCFHISPIFRQTNIATIWSPFRHQPSSHHKSNTVDFVIKQGLNLSWGQHESFSDYTYINLPDQHFIRI